MNLFFAQNITYLRKALRMSQSDVERHLGVSQRTWSNWENNISEPNMKTLIRIAHFFHVPVGDLLEKRLRKS